MNKTPLFVGAVVMIFIGLLFSEYSHLAGGLTLMYIGFAVR